MNHAQCDVGTLSSYGGVNTDRKNVSFIAGVCNLCLRCEILWTAKDFVALIVFIGNTVNFSWENRSPKKRSFNAKCGAKARSERIDLQKKSSPVFG